ncbi:MAG: hypothetical protein OEU51_05135 [Gammaproteobacteria bacterium]|nr:hypothetical protein [Gammaproteobacteria bacterium]
MPDKLGQPLSGDQPSNRQQQRFSLQVVALPEISVTPYFLRHIHTRMEYGDFVPGYADLLCQPRRVVAVCHNNVRIFDEWDKNILVDAVIRYQVESMDKGDAVNAPQPGNNDGNQSRYPASGNANLIFISCSGPEAL